MNLGIGDIINYEYAAAYEVGGEKTVLENHIYTVLDYLGTGEYWEEYLVLIHGVGTTRNFKIYESEWDRIQVLG
jgi:hypothetical protein